MPQKAVETIAKGMAIIGGVVLCVLIGLVCASVLGRELNAALHGFLGGWFPGTAQALLDLGVGPITGDFELVEAGVAFAIFAFFPFCQLRAGHASVDIFTNTLPAQISRIMQVVIDVTFALVLIVIAWQLFQGLQSKLRYGDTTFLLQFPIWWGYAASLMGATAAAIVGVYVAVIRVIECVKGSDILPQARDS